MVVVQCGDQEFYIDGYLKSNLDIAKKQARKDWDFPFVVDGAEGSGKSVFAGQCARYCDPTYGLERCAFTPEQFKEYVKGAVRYQSVVLDEGYGSLASRGAMSRVNRTIVKMLTEIRQKNLFIFVVLPTFFDLDRYFGIWRSKALFSVYHMDFQRGYFRYYSESRKKQLYLKGKKLYDYRPVKHNFCGRFTKHFVYDKAGYDAKKAVATLGEDEDEKHNKMKLAVRNLMVHPKCKGLKKKEVAEIFGVHFNTIGNYTKDMHS